MSDIVRDADFFDLVHQLVQQHQLEESGAERRDSDRHSFESTQHISPFDGEAASPATTDFRAVQCHDLSTTGLSFLSAEPIPADHVMVALGGTPPKLLVAEIMHTDPIDTDAGPQFLIGCHFTGRML